MGCIFVFLTGVWVPVLFIFVHASLRLRNIKNKVKFIVKRINIFKVSSLFFYTIIAEKSAWNVMQNALFNSLNKHTTKFSFSCNLLRSFYIISIFNCFSRLLTLLMFLELPRRPQWASFSASGGSNQILNISHRQLDNFHSLSLAFNKEINYEYVIGMYPSKMICV